MEGVGLRKGWSCAGPAWLHWLGHQAENREGNVIPFFFSFPNLFQILISKAFQQILNFFLKQNNSS